jgi:RES domain-containing protein
MTITAWRLVPAAFAAAAFEGIGARDFPGRWNLEGLRMIYTAETASLAVLEVLIGLDRKGFKDDFVLIPVRLDESVVETPPADSLPVDWNAIPAPQSTRILGSSWARNGRSVALAVPSAVLPLETVYLLNPNHPDFGWVEIGRPVPFSIDPRLRR